MREKIVCQECGSPAITINSDYTYQCLNCGAYNEFEDVYEDEEDKEPKKLRDRDGWD